NPRQGREQLPLSRQLTQNLSDLLSKTDDNRRTSFAPAIRNRPFLPIDVLARQLRDVCLRGARMSEKLVVGARGSVPLAFDNFLVLLKCDRPLFLVLHRRPMQFRRTGQGSQCMPIA